jgi:hypothetical protein
MFRCVLTSFVSSQVCPVQCFRFSGVLPSPGAPPSLQRFLPRGPSLSVFIVTVVIDAGETMYCFLPQ